MLCVDRNFYDTSSENKAKNISDTSNMEFLPQIQDISTSDENMSEVTNR